ncbi:interleukin-1 receptor-like 1 [Trichechus manatus latirostris]|uniref:Interleukin-1 receptor-like 1 n=1 Tax=Trichechus manatus latirostris TaxID=127582 RepID=A0A2Y9D7K4_TRIMA|nr:interleukin-1 receptor-like 1 [Trichechus manatus latirostris]
MGLWVLAILTLLQDSITAHLSKTHWGLENEALIVPCPKNPNSEHPVDWYSKTNRSITTQKKYRVFASKNFLKFLPTKVDDSGIYTCIIRSPTSNWTRSVNLTIYKKQPDCIIPDYLMYSTVTGTPKRSQIFCPTTQYYNWTAPLEWFKNCKPLQGLRYYRSESYLLIDNANSNDAGDYTCKWVHNEKGVSYTVTATRTLRFGEGKAFPVVPVITAPPPNDTKEVEIGKTVNITCLACMGKGLQILASIKWQVNGSSISDLGEARIHQEQVQSQSSRDELTCLKRILRITDVKEEDFSLKYECLALNLRGVTTRAVRLRRKNPIDHQSIYCTVAGFSVLLILTSVLAILLKVFWIDFILLWRDIVRPYKTRNDGKIYDAYVIYSRDYRNQPEGASSVENFVHQILPDVLENKCGYNLCIYGRDLLPGEDVATAVETNIQKSRRHIFILTPHTAHSKEFAYEQEIALHNALLQNKSKVILIEMEAPNEQAGLQLGKFQESLKHLMKVQGTIKWREDRVADKLSLNSKFWKHVRYQMPVPNKLPKKTLNLVSLSAQRR